MTKYFIKRTQLIDGALVAYLIIVVFIRYLKTQIRLYLCKRLIDYLIDIYLSH